MPGTLLHLHAFSLETPQGNGTRETGERTMAPRYIPTEFGRFLYEQLQARQLTPSQFVAEFNTRFDPPITRQMITRYIRGVRSPSIETGEKIAIALGYEAGLPIPGYQQFTRWQPKPQSYATA
jgi:hypothetical protein